MPLSKFCSIQRAAYGFPVPVPVQKSGLTVASNGMQPQMQMGVQQIAATHHELREGFTDMFCVFCAARGTAEEWQVVLQAEAETLGS